MKCKWYSICPLRRFETSGKLSSDWADHYCRGDWQACRRYQLEEQGIPHPDHLLPDGTLDDRLR